MNEMWQIEMLESRLKKNQKGIDTPFVQILDKSMCVIREDICDWLQSYIFNECGVPKLADAKNLLDRLNSGLWLARLAYKLHFKVLATKCIPNGTSVRLREPRGLQVVSKDHRLYSSLRGVGPSSALGQLSSDNLPEFSRSLKLASEAALGINDVSPFENSNAFSGNRHNNGTHEYVDSIKINGTPSTTTGLIENSIATQWVARDSISAFLEWCQQLGISQTVLFETTGLVLKSEEKNVLLTLMDLARLASRFGLCNLPHLVKMEQEIDMLEAERLSHELTFENNINFVNKPREVQIDHNEYIRRVALTKHSQDSSISDGGYDSSIHSNVNETNTSNSDISSELPIDLDNPQEQKENTYCVSVNLNIKQKKPIDSFNLNAHNSSHELDAATDAHHDNSQSQTDDQKLFKNVINVSVKNNSANKCNLEFNNRQINKQNTTQTHATQNKDASVGSIKVKARTTASQLVKPRTVKNGFSNLKSATRSTSLADLRVIKTPSNSKRCQESSQADNVNGKSGKLEIENRKMKQSLVYSKQNSPSKIPLPPNNLTAKPRSSSREPASQKESVRQFKRLPGDGVSSMGTRSASYFDVHAEVRKQISQCTCCSRIHLQRLDEGRYQLGSRIYYMRRFRSHIMVRVGGGWLTLPEFLDRYDPCRLKQGNLTQLKSSHQSPSTGLNKWDKSSVGIRVSTTNLLQSWPSNTPPVEVTQNAVHRLLPNGLTDQQNFTPLPTPF